MFWMHQDPSRDLHDFHGTFRLYDMRIDGARRSSFRMAWSGRGFMIPSIFLLYMVTLKSVYIRVCSRLLGVEVVPEYTSLKVNTIDAKRSTGMI